MICSFLRGSHSCSYFSGTWFVATMLECACWSLSVSAFRISCIWRQGPLRCSKPGVLSPNWLVLYDYRLTLMISMRRQWRKAKTQVQRATPFWLLHFLCWLQHAYHRSRGNIHTRLSVYISPRFSPKDCAWQAQVAFSLAKQSILCKSTTRDSVASICHHAVKFLGLQDSRQQIRILKPSPSWKVHLLMANFPQLMAESLTLRRVAWAWKDLLMA